MSFVDYDFRPFVMPDEAQPLSLRALYHPSFIALPRRRLDLMA